MALSDEGGGTTLRRALTREELDLIKKSQSIQHWEYREERGCTVEQLNALGAEGWELVGLFHPDGKEYIGAHTFMDGTQAPIFERVVHYILKRPKGDAAPMDTDSITVTMKTEGQVEVVKGQEGKMAVIRDAKGEA